MRISDWSSDVCSSDLIVAAERISAPLDPPYRPHATSSLTSASRPVTAAAAAMAGETRWVREPGPWRPTKLRLEVEAQRSPAGTLSGFMARHMEQPGSRHSKPASVDRKSVVSGKSVSVRVDFGGRRLNQKKKKYNE